MFPRIISTKLPHPDSQLAQAVSAKREDGNLNAAIRILLPEDSPFKRDKFCCKNSTHSARWMWLICYNSTPSQLLNKYAPLKSKIIRTKPRNPCYTLALKKLKLAKSHLERIWSRTHSFEDLKNLRSATNYCHAAIIRAKRTYNSFLISFSCTNPRQL